MKILQKISSLIKAIIKPFYYMVLFVLAFFFAICGIFGVIILSDVFMRIIFTLMAVFSGAAESASETIMPILYTIM